ncbi:alpha/beta-Hydrolases superfamily protein [Striga asiatica]|uniref:Alpha/beta-Hydrolases superfamily protein n=1 Tax=Striga asiatica TaxID=4170 RepID=A0A5A7RK24_STRAF|nr:alpha/beta-Hydrolases superfamily protein [Striga asiatica]
MATKPLPPLLLLLSILLLTAGAQFHQHTWQEAFDVLGISWNRDGTLNRTIEIPMLPLVVYLHGGDFVLFSASTVIFHNFCNDIAATLPAVVVSVEHRLAPENRLPAAYDDALNALLWVQSQALGIGGRDPWLEYADFSRVYLLGSASGGNIVYHAALRALDFDLRPVKIRGLMLNQAYFGGVIRTESEIRLKDDTHVALYVNDVLWSLALPRNLNRDHEFCNPISGGTYLGRVYRLPKVYVKGDYGDPLVDRSVQLVRFLQSCRVEVYYRFNEGGFHGIELQNRTAAEQLYNDIKWFVGGGKVAMPEGVAAPGHVADQ